MGSSEKSQAVAIRAPTSGPEPNNPNPGGPMPPADEPAALRSQAQANSKARPAPVVEKHYRSLVKAVTWRATGTFDTIFISFVVTGKIKLAISIGVVELFTKIGLFYVHERIWTRISLGRAQPPEDYTI